jgi:hypothetical protein
MSKLPNVIPTRAEKISALSDIRYEIEGLLQTPKHDATDESIVETVFFRKMAHARSLHIFFTTPLSRRSKDDVVSEDYLFEARAIYSDDKSQELIDRFNKDLFHISYSRVHRTSLTKAWPMDEMLPPIIARSKEFISHVLALGWPDIPSSELQRWLTMQSKRFLASTLAQSTSNVAAPQVASVERYIKDI